MQAGRAIGRAIETTVEQLHRELHQSAAGARTLDQQASDLLGRRSTALEDLAKHYLPDIRPDTVAGTFVEIRDDLLEVLARKQRRQRQLQDELAAAQQELGAIEAELDAVTDSLNEKVAQREQLEEQLAEKLRGSETFRTLSQQALVAERELERNEQRVAELKLEADRKLPAYEQSRLFQYLHRRGFGSPAYQATGFTRRMDRWVAQLIDYPHAQRGYVFLQTTPRLMADEVERRRDQFNALMEQVEAIEDRVSDEVGLTGVLREGEQLGSHRDELVGRVAQQQDSLGQTQEQLLQLERPENEFYEQAIARVKNFLGNLRAAQLERQSRETPEREDDAIVAELSWLNQQVENTDQQILGVNRDRQRCEQRWAGLQGILQRFRAADFDSQRSEFAPKLVIESLLSRFVRDEVSAEEVWETLRERQRFAPAWHEQRGVDLGNVIDSDVSYVLMRVLSEVAGQAMRGSAYRGVQRREPERRQSRKKSGRPPFRKRGFTNGRGF